MTTTLTPSRPATPHRAPGGRPHAPHGAAFRLAWRLVRRSTVLLWLVVAAYMVIEVLSFQHTYPDQASRQRLIEMSQSSAVRMMQGVPSRVDTAGGFAIWDGGWVLMLIVGCWALLTTTRLTRGEEDSGRAEMVLSRPVRPDQLLMSFYGVFFVAMTGIAVAASVPLITLGEPVEGALLWGVALALFGSLFAVVGAASAQALQPRRMAASLALGIIAASFLLRVVANSAGSRVWILTVTPFGWVDHTRPYSDNVWWWLAVPVAVAGVVGGAALMLRRRRDTGAAMLSARAARPSRLHLLGGATSFGWRLNSGTLLAWSIAMGVTSLVYGLLVGALVDFIENDESYRKLLESMGMDMSVPVIGFLSYIANFIALPVALFVAWRAGALRQEEAEGRLDNLLVRGVRRRQLLPATTALAFAAACLLVFLSGLGLWLGAELVDVDVTVRQVAEPMVGTLPLLLVFIGIATLAYGLVPRLTVGLPATLAVAAYLLETFGTLLEWPRWLVALSPFDHLARLPAEPMTTASVVTMSALGLAMIILGVVAFVRRDLKGA